MGSSQSSTTATEEYTASLMMAQSLPPAPSSSPRHLHHPNPSPFHHILYHNYNDNYTAPGDNLGGDYAGPLDDDFDYYPCDYVYESRNYTFDDYINCVMGLLNNTTIGLAGGWEEGSTEAPGKDYDYLRNLPDEDILPDPLPWNIKVAFVILYSLIIVLAIAGNALVIAVIARTPTMRTVTNTFLVSLAVSDLCIASINMPFQLKFYLQNEWTLGEGLCKFSKYMQGVVIVASIFTLTGIAIDRYYAIMHPLRARNVHTSRRAVLILSLFWLLAFGLLLPQVFIQRIEPLILLQPHVAHEPIRIANVCVEYFTNPAYNIAYTVFFYFALYLAPVAIMSVTYGIIARKLWKRRRIGETPDEDGRRLREKKRIVRMLVVIVVLFSVSWFPFFTCHLYQLFVPPELGRDFKFRILMAVLQLIGYSNSCINPFIYCFMNDKFQKSAISTFCCKCVAQKLNTRRHSSHTYIGTQPTTNTMLMESKSVPDSPMHKTAFL